MRAQAENTIHCFIAGWTKFFFRTFNKNKEIEVFLYAMLYFMKHIIPHKAVNIIFILLLTSCIKINHHHQKKYVCDMQTTE